MQNATAKAVCGVGLSKQTKVVFYVRFRALYKRLEFALFRSFLRKRRQAAVTFCINRLLAEKVKQI